MRGTLQRSFVTHALLALSTINTMKMSATSATQLVRLSQAGTKYFFLYLRNLITVSY
jgi:hypothetical protein